MVRGGMRTVQVSKGTDYCGSGVQEGMGLTEGGMGMGMGKLSGQRTAFLPLRLHPQLPIHPPAHPAVPAQRSAQPGFISVCPSPFSRRALPGLEPVPGDLADRR